MSRTSQTPALRWPALVLGGGMMVVLAGCKEDTEIQHYRVPRVEALPRPAHRMLAAIAPQGDKKIWFFKLEGLEGEVAPHKEAFEKFIGSLRFKDDETKPLIWTLPEGWWEGKEKGKGGMRYATLHLGPKGDPLELSVTFLGPEAKSVLANVNRWRGQVGLPPTNEAGLAEDTREIKADGNPVILVDLTGPGVRGGGRPPLAPKKFHALPPLKYDTPPGWTENPNPKPPRVASFEVKEGDKIVAVTVLPFPGQTGTVLANVNRWRDEVALSPVTEDQLNKEVRNIDLAGAPAHYVDLAGPQKRVLAAWREQGSHTWFFKMFGPPEAVGKQKENFEKFIKSVKFDPAGK